MSTSDHSKLCPGSICDEASRMPAICCCGFYDAANEEPRYEKRENEIARIEEVRE